MMRFLAGLAGVVAIVGALPAQAPPPIAPAQARLEATIGGLPSPGIGLAHQASTGILVAGCDRGPMQYWDRGVTLGVRVGEGTPHTLEGSAAPVVALAWGAGPTLAAASADRTISLWTMPEGKLTRSLPTETQLRSIAISSDGKFLAGGGEDGIVRLWDATTAMPVSKIESGGDWVLALAFSPDGKTLFSGGHDGLVRGWMLPEGKKVLEIQPGLQPTSVTALAVSPDGKFLAVGGRDSIIQLLSLPAGKLERSIPGHTSTITALAFHPSGSVLASSSKDRTARLWNPANGQIIKALEGHTAWVQDAKFVANGTRLATIGADQTVRLWDLSEAKK